mgnify:CR=1 FL=1
MGFWNAATSYYLGNNLLLILAALLGVDARGAYQGEYDQ